MSKKNYAGYVNPELNNSARIFSREQIKSMSPEEYSENEKAIFHQMKTIGLPSKQELNNSSGVVYVHSYTRGDGTPVIDHYRSLPNGGTENSPNDDTGDSTGDQGGESTGEKPPVLQGHIDKNQGDQSGESDPEQGQDPQPDPNPNPEPEPEPGPNPKQDQKPKLEIDDKENKQNTADLHQILVDAKLVAGLMSTVKDVKDDTSQNSSSQNNKSTSSISPSSHSQIIEAAKANLNNSSNKLKASLNNQKANLDSILNKIASTKDQATYRKLMKEYSGKKQTFDTHSQKMNIIDNLAKNGQYQEIANNSRNSIPADQITGAAAPAQKFNSYELHEPTEIRDRLLFKIAKSVKYVPSAPTATEFAHNSLNWLRTVPNNSNSILINSVREISDTQFRTYLQDRINNILHRQDCRGIVYKSESDVAKRIANSHEFRKALFKNTSEWKKNHKIILKPVTFEQDKDLENAIHNATIYKAWIDTNGDLKAIVYDIYDFNEIKNRDDIGAKVNNQMEKWQKHKNIENYFVLILVTINKNELPQSLRK